MGEEINEASVHDIFHIFISFFIINNVTLQICFYYSVVYGKTSNDYSIFSESVLGRQFGGFGY